MATSSDCGSYSWRYGSDVYNNHATLSVTVICSISSLRQRLEVASVRNILGHCAAITIGLFSYLNQRYNAFAIGTVRFLLLHNILNHISLH